MALRGRFPVFEISDSDITCSCRRTTARSDEADPEVLAHFEKDTLAGVDVAERLNILRGLC